MSSSSQALNDAGSKAEPKKKEKKEKKNSKDGNSETTPDKTKKLSDEEKASAKEAKAAEKAAEKEAKAAEKAERIRQAAEKAEKARRAAEDEPESWDDQEGGAGEEEEELDSWDADDDDDGAEGSNSAEPSKPVFEKAALLALKDWTPSEDMEEEFVGKVEAIFGPLRAKPQERPSIEEMERNTLAAAGAAAAADTTTTTTTAASTGGGGGDDDKWGRGEKMAEGRQNRGDGQSWRQKEGPGLVKTENAWKPGRGTQSEDDKTLKKVNGLLNKLTLEKFESLLERFLEL
jgi:hypothetical protein